MFVSINMHAAEDAVPFTNISILEFQVASTFRTCTLRVPPAMWLGGISHFNPFYRWECPMFFHSPLALGLDRVVFSRMAPQKNRRGRAHGTRKVWQNCFFFHRRAMIRVENWQETYGLSVLPSSGGQCRFIFFQNHQLLAQQSEQNSQIDIQRFKLQSYNFSSKPRSKYVIRSLAPRSGSQEH